MSEMDRSCVLGPLTPTYMPYFLPHRSPLHSSSNTRQRDDYELSSHSCPSSPSPHVISTWEDDEDYEPTPAKPDRLIEGYPASELPFASEPALEGELEQGLPPLKKLKPDCGLDVAGAQFDKTSAHGIVLLGAIKGILTRRAGTPGDSSSRPQSPPSSSPLAVDTCFIPWSRSPSINKNNLSTLTTSSAPLSRRSSSGASSVCTGSLKAVRFASGNIANEWSDPQQSHVILPGEVEGPVAAVMYLTHSAEAYDRSPIVVEDGLRLPPRAKNDDEADEPTVRLDKKRRAKLNIEILKIGRNRLGSKVLSPPSTRKLEAGEHCEDENSIIIKTPLSIGKSYREAEEVDEEDEETVGPGSLVDENEEVEEEENELEPEAAEEASDDDDDNDDDIRNGRATNSERWGLGKWSSGEVFGCCDALGGF